MRETDKPNQYAEFLRVMSTEGEKKRLEIEGAASFERYFESHPEIRNGEPTITQMSIGKWLRKFGKANESDYESFVEMVRNKADEDPRWATLYKNIVDKSKEVEDIELTNDQISSDANNFTEYFRKNFTDGAVCPLCGFARPVSSEVCADKVS
jgi:hypothetical protein